MAIELLCRKVGMTQIYDDQGNCIPVTVLEAEANQVVQKKTVESDGYNAIQLGGAGARPNRVVPESPLQVAHGSTGGSGRQSVLDGNSRLVGSCVAGWIG